VNGRQLEASYAAEDLLRRMGAHVVAEHEPGYALAPDAVHGPQPDEDTSEDRCHEHGFDECPDCGNGGVKMTAAGYRPCTRFLTCWSDPTDGP
jgi:hypothetical protein